MATSILYPFLTTADNQSSYFDTLKLAEDLNAEVICFTSVNDDKDLDDAYLHLLELNGQYQTLSKQWQSSVVSTKTALKIGAFDQELIDYLAQENIDILVCRTQKKLVTKASHQTIKQLPSSPKIIRLNH